MPVLTGGPLQIHVEDVPDWCIPIRKQIQMIAGEVCLESGVDVVDDRRDRPVGLEVLEEKFGLVPGRTVAGFEKKIASVRGNLSADADLGTIAFAKGFSVPHNIGSHRVIEDPAANTVSEPRVIEATLVGLERDSDAALGKMIGQFVSR